MTLEEMKDAVRYDEMTDCVALWDGDTWYSISLDQILGSEFQDWIRHLRTKVWYTREQESNLKDLLKGIIEVAFRRIPWL